MTALAPTVGPKCMECNLAMGKGYVNTDNAVERESKESNFCQASILNGSYPLPLT